MLFRSPFLSISSKSHTGGFDDDRCGSHIRGFLDGFQALPKKQRQAVVGKLLQDEEFVEGLIDAVILEQRRGEPSRSLNEYLLPTEAEWEYACRAGTTGAFGESSEVKALDAAGWYGGNSGGRLHRVGQKAPDRWGLYDMRGNVWEWCQDRLGPYSDAAVSDPQGPAHGADRILRGGCLRNDATWCRSASRDSDEPDDRSGFAGFRVAAEAPPTPAGP